MIPNPAYLGLEALLPKNTVTYQQIQKMSSDLKITSDELVRITGLFINAHTLYRNSLRDPVSYMTAMRTMDLKQPDDLLKMYVSTEEAYEGALQSYEHCVDRYVKYCTANMQDEKYKLVYLQMIDQALHDYRAVESLDPRGTYEDVTWSAESFQIRDGVDQVSMEGFFKNIIESIKHTFTRDLKCKAIVEDVIKLASNVSKEADDKFKSIAHEFKCPPSDEMKTGIEYLGPTSKFLSERFEDFKEAHKSIFTRKMSREEQKNYLTKFLREHRMHFNQWGAKYGDFHLILKKEGTYGSLGYDIKKAIQLFKLYVSTSAGTRKCLKTAYGLASGHTQIDSIIPVVAGDSVTIVITTSIKKEWRLCVAHLERLLSTYDKLDYSIYRIGKDIKSCL